MVASQSFRSVERQSSNRANIFLLECTVVLGIHLTASHCYLLPGPQRVFLDIFAICYMIRLIAMSRWLLPRELAMEELTFVILIWVPAILASFTLGAMLHPINVSPTSTQLIFSGILYVGGSFLNSYSELQRKWWKTQPNNFGRCFTLGLFSWSRNINYFGDVVLFGAWAIATGAWWNVWVPVAMFLSFYFHHIPDKEKYLAQRYAKDWPAYEASTKALIPWVL